MRKIILIIIGIIFLAIGSFFLYEYKIEKDVEDFANSKTEVSTSKSDVSTRMITMQEVSLHNKKSDCWMVINNSVIDVTTFVDKHPGGDRILQGCGQDATEYFNSVPGHLKGIAQMVLNKLTIGVLQK